MKSISSAPPRAFAPYGAQFHRLAAPRAARSAEVVVPLVARWLAPRSVIDVGCGAGAWLEVWKRHGAREVVGVEQSLVDRASLRIAAHELVIANLARPFELPRGFDLATSLEVAEHLEPAAAETFVDTLVRLAPVVLFSAAVPGQMGDHHVNERPHEYWRDLFEARGYALFDPLRPLLRGDRRVRTWYRTNLLLYARRTELAALPDEVLRSEVAAGSPIADLRSRPMRAAMRAASLLPRPVVQLFASSERWLRRAWASSSRG